MKKSNQKGMGFLSLLLALVIIGLVYVFISQSPKGSAPTKSSYLKQTSIDAAGYKNTLDHTKQTIADAVKIKTEQGEGF